MTTPAFSFTKAIKGQEKLRLALDGPSGSGKTWTALTLGAFLAEKEGGRIAVIDSERSSAKKYAAHFDFDHLTLPDFAPDTYMGAIRAAIAAGYAVIVIDSFTHAWEGVLEYKDAVTARSKSHNSYTEGWREATPLHNELVDTVLRAPAHVIVTLRTKTEYLVEDSKVKKVGTKPIQREGTEYEFDIVGDMDLQNTLTVSKTRCPELTGAVIRRPDDRLAERLWAWLQEGEPVVSPAQAGGLVDRMNALEPDVRKERKLAFVDRFGRPEQLLVSKLDDASKLIASYEDSPPDGGGQTSPQIGGDGPASPTIGDAGAEVAPPPSAPATAGRRKKSDASTLHIEAGRIEGVGEDGLGLVIANQTGGATTSAKDLDTAQVYAVADQLTRLSAMDLADRQLWLAEVRELHGAKAQAS